MAVDPAGVRAVPRCGPDVAGGEQLLVLLALLALDEEPWRPLPTWMPS
ncbi:MULTISPECIES: hypothetical protein [unclassified Streptomyces]